MINPKMNLNSNRNLILTEFNIYGCPLSTDIDVACIVDNKEIIELVKNHRVKIDYTNIIAELINLGYTDVNESKVDLNLIYLDKDGDISLVLKGNKETQNILFHTYSLHNQKYQPIITRPVDLDPSDKIRAIAKFILDNLDVLLGREEYLKERQNKKSAYAGGWLRIQYAVTVCNKIKFEETPDFKDVMKSLTMKIVQACLAEKEIYDYTKLGMANKFGCLYPQYEKDVLYLLTRGKYGEKLDTVACVKFLIQRYAEIASALNSECNWANVELDLIRNPTILPDTLYKEFISSPLQPTEKFIRDYMKFCYEYSIGEKEFLLNELFQIKCTNENLIPEHIKDKFVFVDQRSQEWLDLLKYFQCGKNTGVVQYSEGRQVETYYNLIRGAIVELLIIKNVQFDLEKICVGFAVESKSKDSKGISPDLILYDKDELIPVEIKCLHSEFREDHDFRRAVKLAKGQLKSFNDIIGGNRGIIFLVNVYRKDGMVRFEGRMTQISFNN